MAAPATPASNPESSRSSGRFELWLALGLVGFGLLVLPALIYLTGSILLGAYGGGEHIGSFYGDYFRDLVAAPLTWVLVLGPYVLVQIARFIFRTRDATGLPPSPEPPEPERRSRAEPRERREPTLKL